MTSCQARCPAPAASRSAAKRLAGLYISTIRCLAIRKYQRTRSPRSSPISTWSLTSASALMNTSARISPAAIWLARPTDGPPVFLKVKPVAAVNAGPMSFVLALSEPAW